ncbi:hypothetical protein HDZ31DRAFT_45856 [Schizophyllum fasciatum]
MTAKRSGPHARHSKAQGCWGREVDVIDLCSDSEDESTAAPPAKKPRLASPVTSGEFVQGSSGSYSACAPGYVESDEALARRLAAEWDMIDVDAEDNGAALGPSVDKGLTRRLASGDVALIEGSEREADPEDALRAFAETFTRIRPCPRCGKNIASPRGHVVLNGDVGIPPSLGLLLHAPCSSCPANHCRGCFSPDCTVHLCCSTVRVIALFEALGSFDRQILNERAAADARAAAASKGKGKHDGSVGPRGTGYGADTRYGGYGFGPSCSLSYSRAYAEPRKGNRKEELGKHWDTLTIRALQIITDILPAPYSPDPAIYDVLPHAATGHLLTMSLLPDVLAALLRNDSITDWISRMGTYRSLLALLKRLADSELTARVLVGTRREMRQSCGIEPWIWRNGEIMWEKVNDKYSMLPPLYEHFRKLVKQCSAFLTAVQQKNEDWDEDTIVAVSLCGDIMAAKDDMDRVMKMLETSGTIVQEPTSWKGLTRENAQDPLERRYADMCERLAFRHVPLDDASRGIDQREGLHYSHYNYDAHVQKTQNSTRRSGDTLHIAREQAALSTGLPSGIFVRVDETRNDVIKAMIAGPDGTPYANGLYEFDIFLPLDYPRIPPLVHLRTTGGGKVRFNPNLYESGKVCLSLLGTWPGQPDEQWQPYKSTLLQVLVSIQSMILIDVPYFNEPGMGAADPRNRQSIMYNRNINVENTRLAIVAWMKTDHRSGIWRDVIRAHFLTRKITIQEQIMEWAAIEPRMKSYWFEHNTWGGAIEFHPYTGHRRRPNEGRYGGLNLVAEFERAVDDLSSWETDEEERAD